MRSNLMQKNPHPLRYLSIFMVAVIALLSLIPIETLPVYAVELSDIQGHWAEPFIREVSKYNVVSGFPDGTFKPNDIVNRDQFIRMVVGSENIPLRTALKDEYWATPYIEQAIALNLISEDYFGSITKSNYAVPISREEMASILVKTYRLKNPPPTSDKIEDASGRLSDFNKVNTLFLDDVITSVALGYINGLPDQTFAPQKQATRSEAAKVLYVHLSKVGIIVPESTPADIKTVKIGSQASSVIEQYGEPLRKDLNAYGFYWWIYHNQYNSYTAIGVRDQQVVGYYTLNPDFPVELPVTIGMKKSEVDQLLGAPISSIHKNDGVYHVDNTSLMSQYLWKDVYVKAHYDTHNDGKLYGIQVISKNEEENLQGFYGLASPELKTAYEMQIFDLANAFRVQRNLTPFDYSKEASQVACQHSEHMATYDFFDHVDPQGNTVVHRFKTFGMTPNIVAENIASGYLNGFDAHNGWVNSWGHRQNLLRDLQYLGVGVFFGGESVIYYTQNMYQ